jgi:toxin ParE1/3/4
VTASKFTVRLLSTAEQDLLDIIDYLVAENPQAAPSVVDRIEKRLKNLTRHPLLGRVPADTKLARLNYRVLVVVEYLVFYKVHGKTILIYRIIRGSRDVVPLLEDL